MKTVRLFKPDNTLARRLTRGRGIDAPTAIAAGDRAVAGYRTEALAEIDRLMEVFRAELDSVKASDRIEDKLPDIYATAESVVGLAGLFGRPELGEAAASLCELLATRKNASSAKVGIYLDAILLIHRDAASASELLPQLTLLKTGRARSWPRRSIETP